jgi:hypothetical protein
MDHPLINNIDSLSIEELQSKISDLTKKLGFAYRTGNQNLIGQIRLALNSYQGKYNEKVQAMYESTRKSGPDFSDKIDIS